MFLLPDAILKRVLAVVGAATVLEMTAGPVVEARMTDGAEHLSRAEKMLREKAREKRARKERARKAKEAFLRKRKNQTRSLSSAKAKWQQKQAARLEGLRRKREMAKRVTVPPL